MLCREKDVEVSSLKQAVAERDVKLKSAKGELLEARMSLQQKDSELKVRAEGAIRQVTKCFSWAGSAQTCLCTPGGHAWACKA